MTVRIGVIGTGAIGRDHARRINQVLSGGTITALSDVNRASAEAVKAEIARAEARLNGQGRVLIRKSGTEPLIRVMAEAEDEHVLREVVDGIVAAVEKAA